MVPLLDVLDELARCGAPSDARRVAEDPARAWASLPKEAAEALLGRYGHGAPLAHPRFVLVRRRGQEAVPANLLLRIGGPVSWRASLELARDAVAFARVRGSGAVRASTGKDAVFRKGGSGSMESAIELLDAAWGDPPYDETRDGVLCPPAALVRDELEVERYWVAPPFGRVAIARTPAGELTYLVSEPPLSSLEGAVMASVNERLRETLLADEGDASGRAQRLANNVVGLLRAHRLRPDRRACYTMGYYFLRNYLGFGRIDAVMRDDRIEDVSCNGPDIPLFVVHGKHANLRTNLRFEELELNSFVIKLGQTGSRLLSTAQPLADATLRDGSRIQASLGREVTSRGSAFTIRKFRGDPLTCVDLIRMGTHSTETMAFLWLAVELKRSMVVMGATASGKTTTLNCLSQFIPPAQKIVTIEDTREITLQHENWLSATTREAVGGRAPGSDGSVSMYDLLRAALRQRPDYILVGEIRGAEGLTLFQAMSTGHTCFSTMHAGSTESAVYRLENPPIGVPRVMLTALDLFLLQGQVEHGGGSVRRLLSITEVNGVDAATKNLRTNEVFRWDSTSDSIVLASPSGVLDEARSRLGWTHTRVEEELQARARVLDRLVVADRRHFRQVAEAIHDHYRARSARVPVTGPLASDRAIPTP